MSILSRFYSFYKAYQTKNASRQLLLLPKVSLNVAPAGTLKINPKAVLTIGQNWTNLPFFTTGVKVDNGGSLTVNGKFKIYSGSVVAVYKGATLELGSGYLNNGGDVQCFEKITIGDNVIIASQVSIRDSDNHEIVGQRFPVSAPIVIEDNVWIGMRATILKGVTIGKGAVVAAGSVVTKDVPPGCLVGGVPAKVLRENITWK